MLVQNALFDRLDECIQRIPVIDCHEHMQGPDALTPYKEPIAALIRGYVFSDLQSAAFGVPDRELARLQDHEVPTDEKWPLFERLWRATEHTAYAQVTKWVLKTVYGEREMTRDALERVAAQLAGRDEDAYFRTFDEAGIKAMIVDVLGWLDAGFKVFLDGEKTFPDRWKLMISLPGMHPTNLTAETIAYYGSLVDRHITSLDEYLEAIYAIFERCIERGAIGIKDQSAYNRTLSYDLVPQADAERLFNRALGDPRNSLGWPEGKPLNDFMFHQFMRFARDLNLTVQLHTGHMAGIRNRVDKTNAAYLTSVLEVHQQVRFDLFHGNWPYMGDLLFLGKNYPNVALDLCWLHIIDPDYAVELLQRATLTMPHSKIHGFGGDYGDVPEFAAGHLSIARRNIAVALTHLVEGGWIDETQALTLAADWLFNNPNRFFNLGFEAVRAN
ncbi:MAG: amidohydrolase family protein [Anaerolineae bacterium]|nr:amidohydrolase family protein [Anaerolineae bacterium]